MNRSCPDSNSLDELDSAIDNSVARDALDDAMHGGGKIKALRPIPRDQNLAHTMGLIRSSKSERSISMGDAVGLPRSLSRRRLAPMEPQGSMRMIRPLEEEPCSMIDPPSDKEKTYLPLPETLGRMTNQSSRSKSADPQRSGSPMS